MNVTPENIFECHKKLVESVRENDYYVYLLKEDEQLDTPASVINFWNDFWYSLPDTGTIRKQPFFDICDMAECIGDPDFY